MAEPPPLPPAASGIPPPEDRPRHTPEEEAAFRERIREMMPWAAFFGVAVIIVVVFFAVAVFYGGRGEDLTEPSPEAPAAVESPVEQGGGGVPAGEQPEQQEADTQDQVPVDDDEGGSADDESDTPEEAAGPVPPEGDTPVAAEEPLDPFAWVYGRYYLSEPSAEEALRGVYTSFVSARGQIFIDGDATVTGQFTYVYTAPCCQDQMSRVTVESTLATVGLTESPNGEVGFEGTVVQNVIVVPEEDPAVAREVSFTAIGSIDPATGVLILSQGFDQPGIEFRP